MKNTMPVDEYKKLYASNKPKGAKYRNKPTQRIVGDRVISFHSLKEAAYYDELMLLLKAGKIASLRLQPQFTLKEAYTTPDGERIRAIRYQADFSFLDIELGTTKLIVVDVKGGKATKTRDYVIKKKLMQEKYVINVVEV